MKKKTLKLVALIALISGISIAGTLAWLTSEDSNTNTFTVGKVAIELTEADVDENGELIFDEEGNPVERVDGNEYHLVPGKEYIKDPTVTVQADSEESYVRMILEVTRASELQKLIEKHELEDYSVFLDKWDEEVWLYKDFTVDTEKDIISFEFRYKETVKAEDENVVLPALFSKIKVPGAFTGEELEELQKEEFKMTVYGHAIQTVGFENEDEAWTAFGEQMSE